MTYEEARKYIKEAGRSGMMPGLVRMRALLRYLGDPQDKLQFIHIAGTNGKGSVAAYISSILAVSGHLVGRYVSPAVFEYEECIQYEDMDGVHHIDRELLAQVVTEAAAAVDKMRQEGEEVPTVFEIETAMAFLAFVHWNCGVVVLEAGLGGKEDATNVISSVVASVITPISLDHQAVLGNTIQDIALAKAGIIRENGVVATCQEDPGALAVIREQASGKKASLYEVEKSDIMVLTADLEGSVFTYRQERYHTFMAGLYQVENAALAIEACCRLPEPFHFTGQELVLGIRKASWQGRFEEICTRPPVIIDGAHNPAGARALRNTIEGLLCRRQLHGVMGVLKDKDYEAMVEILSPLFDDVVTITPPGERGLDKDILADVWREKGCQKVISADTVMAGLEKAVERCGEEDAILIFGSLSFFKELNGESLAELQNVKKGNWYGEKREE